MSRRAALLAALLVGAAVPALPAQRALQWDLALSGVGVRLNSTTGPTTQQLSGAVYGVQGQLIYSGFVTLDWGYWQGQIDPADGSGATAPRDVVEGYAMLGGRPFGWLSVRAGPHAWTYISNAGTQRWFLWEARARAQGEILPDVQSYLDVYRVLSANVNVPQDFQSGMGGEGGLILLVRDAPIIPEQFPVRIRLGYGIERIRMGGGIRTEVMDRLSLSLGIGQR
ncbi:MAG: hypothetical protein ACREMW_04600 [Gemmatimonadales bacterium]